MDISAEKHRLFRLLLNTNDANTLRALGKIFEEAKSKTVAPPPPGYRASSETFLHSDRINKKFHPNQQEVMAFAQDLEKTEY